MFRYPSLLALIVLSVPSLAQAQPAFKLGVGSHLFPSARLEFKGPKLHRTVVLDDPGFRLQYHFIKDGKTAAAIDARGLMDLDLPHKDPGVYAVALELFYPTYRAGNEQKGVFKAISPFLTYRFQPAAKPGDPPTVTMLTPTPALVLHCGKAKQQEEKAEKGYGFKLTQGSAAEPWPAAAKNHCWQDAKAVRFEITLPAETAGTLRLLCLDGDAAKGAAAKRRQKIVIQGRPMLPELTDFAGQGKVVELPLSAAEVKMGKIEVNIEALQEGASAVVSAIEFLPALNVK